MSLCFFVELKEKMSLAGVEAVSGQITMDSTPSADDTTIGMATTVLINWGVNKLVAEDLISKVATPQDTLETLLQKAFKSLGR